MASDEDSQRTQSVTDSSRQITPPKTIADVAKRPQTLYYAFKQKSITNSTVSGKLVILLVGLYALCGAVLAVMLGPLSIVGYLAVTTGTMIGGLTLQDGTSIATDSTREAAIYYATATIFICVGVRYILFGHLDAILI